MSDLILEARLLTFMSDVLDKNSSWFHPASGFSLVGGQASIQGNVLRGIGQLVIVKKVKGNDFEIQVYIEGEDIHLIKDSDFPKALKLAKKYCRKISREQRFYFQKPKNHKATIGRWF